MQAGLLEDYASVVKLFMESKVISLISILVKFEQFQSKHYHVWN